MNLCKRCRLSMEHIAVRGYGHHGRIQGKGFWIPACGYQCLRCEYDPGRYPFQRCPTHLHDRAPIVAVVS